MSNKRLICLNLTPASARSKPPSAVISRACPDGKYQVNVEKAELTEAHTSGNPMLKWTLR